MNEQGGFIVSIKTLERVDFERLGSRYNFDLFQHSTTFDEEKKQFIVDALVNLEQIGQLVRDGYVVEVKAYHLAQGLASPQIVNISEWLKEDAARDKAEKDKEEKGKAKKGKANKGKFRTPRQEPPEPYIGGESLPMRQYLDYNGFLQAFNIIHERHPNITSFFTQELTHEGRAASILRIHAPPHTNKPGVLFIGGLHARELVNPDTLVSLAMDLLYIFSRTARNLKYGSKIFANNSIKSIIRNLDIYLLPLANPDGRVHAMNTYNMWRMNRNPNGGQTCPGSTCPQVDGKGVDCNRNFDFLWNSGIMTSPNPCGCSQIYKGTRSFSEPETRQIQQLLDNNALGIDSVVDVHSYREAVLHPWQIDENQTTNTTMNFRNPAYDGQRGTIGDTYKEYIPQNDLNRYGLVAGKMRDTIRSVRGRQYAAGPGAITIYPASATSSDYAYSRHFDSTKTKVFAMAIETGRMFNPVNPENGVPVGQDEKWQITKEISAGLVEFLIQRNTRP